jgi:hypothetical protein
MTIGSACHLPLTYVLVNTFFVFLTRGACDEDLWKIRIVRFAIFTRRLSSVEIDESIHQIKMDIVKVATDTLTTSFIP